MRRKARSSRGRQRGLRPELELLQKPCNHKAPFAAGLSKPRVAKVSSSSAERIFFAC